MRATIAAACLPALLAFAGCGAPTKVFKVASFPAGATVYVDDKPRGQTEMERLQVIFPRPLVTIRLEKEGYQPAGAVIGPDSSPELAFFLHETPDNRKILKALDDILRTLVQIREEIDKGPPVQSARSQP